MESMDKVFKSLYCCKSHQTRIMFYSISKQTH